LSPSAAQKVLDIVSNTGAIPHSLAFAKFYEQKALAALEKLLPGRVGHLSTYASHFLSNIKI
jgi:geranylgeranyl pyrophosphate synthase